MLAVVKELWQELNRGKKNQMMEKDKVARMLVDLKAIQDISSAHKYIVSCVHHQRHYLEWDDFNSIFCKGITKDVIISTSKSLTK